MTMRATKPRATASRATASRRPRKRKFSDPGRTWARRLERYRPGLVPFVLDTLAERYGRPTWQRRLDPTSELILTILTQNSADTNAEVAFQALREAYPSGGEVVAHAPGPGWGGVGLPDGAPPDGPASRTHRLLQLCSQRQAVSCRCSSGRRSSAS